MKYFIYVKNTQNVCRKKNKIQVYFLLSWFSLLFQKMLCILKIAEPSCQIRFSLKLRKHCLAQSITCLHQNSFDKPVQNYPVQRLSKSDKTKVIPKHVYNFYLPLGSKRNSFVNREDKSTNVIRNNSILNALNKSENGGNKFEKKALFSHELLSSKEDRLSKRENILLCNSQEDARSKISKKDDKDPKANLELISDRLTQDLTNIFMKRQNWSIYRNDLVFQDTSRGSCWTNFPNQIPLYGSKYVCILL